MMVIIISIGNSLNSSDLTITYLLLKKTNLKKLFKFLECFTPNGDNGNCINIKSCPTLLNLLENQGHNTSIATFLIKSQCGDEDNFPYYPKVCCLLKDEIYETVSSIKLPSQDTCGRSNVSQTLIFGGSFAELGIRLKINKCIVYF